jgi:GNAT superfamily N-acetyltransferase
VSFPSTRRREVAAELQIRLAGPADAPAVAAAVCSLLSELGASPERVDVERATASALLSDPHVTTVLIAEEDGVLVGMLGVSWPLAIRALGRYALIQELWVRPSHRSNAVGSELLVGLLALAQDRGVRRIEVGLPGEGFEQLARTEAFYLANGFEAVGPRMRRSLP